MSLLSKRLNKAMHSFFFIPEFLNIAYNVNSSGICSITLYKLVYCIIIFH